jgi:hypothetical protein
MRQDSVKDRYVVPLIYFTFYIRVNYYKYIKDFNQKGDNYQICGKNLSYVIFYHFII